jgi:hypothetical protein
MSYRTEIFDFLRIPRVSVRKTVTLGVALVSAVPESAPAVVTVTAQALETATLALQSDYQQREDAESGVVQEFDWKLDHAWGALHDVLRGVARVPFPSPRKTLAQSLFGKLFSDGLSFLTLSSDEEWFESRVRLTLIEEKNLEQALTTATGDESILAAIRTAHAEFGNVLKITEAASVQNRKNLLKGIDSVREAMLLYVAQVVAWAQQDDGQHLDDAYLALEPIRSTREAAAHSTPSGSKRRDDNQTPKSETPKASNDPAVDAKPSETPATAPAQDAKDEPKSTAG